MRLILLTVYILFVVSILFFNSLLSTPHLILNLSIIFLFSSLYFYRPIFAISGFIIILPLFKYAIIRFGVPNYFPTEIAVLTLSVCWCIEKLKFRQNKIKFNLISVFWTIIFLHGLFSLLGILFSWDTYNFSHPTTFFSTLVKNILLWKQDSPVYHFSTVITYFEALILCFILSEKVNHRSQLEVILKTLTLSLVIPSFFVIFQLYNPNLINFVGISGFSGTFENKNMIGFFISSLLPFSLYLIFTDENRCLKFFWAFIFLISISALIICHARTPLIAILFGAFNISLVFLYKRPPQSRYLLLLAYFFITIILIFFLTDPLIELLQSASLNERIMLWKQGLQHLLLSPFSGVGVGTFFIRSVSYTEPYYDAHNYFVDISTQLGLAPLIFILFFFMKTILKLLKQSTLSSTFLKTKSNYILFSILILFINLQGDHVVLYKNMTYLFVIILFVATRYTSPSDVNIFKSESKLSIFVPITIYFIAYSTMTFLTQRTFPITKVFSSEGPSKEESFNWARNKVTLKFHPKDSTLGKPKCYSITPYTTQAFRLFTLNIQSKNRLHKVTMPQNGQSLEVCLDLEFQSIHSMNKVLFYTDQAWFPFFTSSKLDDRGLSFRLQVLSPLSHEGSIYSIRLPIR